MLKTLVKKLGPLKALIIASEAGRVTRKYPFEPPLVSEEFRGKIEIDESKCIGCGACVNACPPNALTMEQDNDTKVLKYFVGRCIYCWRCIDVCPTSAIRGTLEFELATNNIDDLYEIVVHEVVKCRICGKPVTTIAMKDFVLEKTRYAEEYIDLDPHCRKEKFIKAIEARFGYSEQE